VATGQEFDVEQLMQRIRENVRRRRDTEDDSASRHAVPLTGHDQAEADLDHLSSAYDVQNVRLVSHRLLIGSFVVAVKRLLRKLLTPTLERQVAYNAANARVTVHLGEWIRMLDRRQAQGLQAANDRIQALEGDGGEIRQVLRAIQEDMRAVQSQLQRTVDGFDEKVAAQSRDFDEKVAAQSRAFQRAQQSNRGLREQISAAERKLRRIIHAIEHAAPPPGRPETTPSDEPCVHPLRELELESEFDYAGFAERFRGSQQEVRDRQRSYLKYFEARTNVLDIGCGRGEFLELLRENGIKGRGLDLDLDMVLLCREKGLDVARVEALAYLGALPDDSIDGIFAAQVIEHLHPQQIIELVRLCHRKLAPGTVLILETPNPACLMVFADSFYRDPSHVRPIHADTMEFLFETTGFHEIELKFSSPVHPALTIPRLHTAGADVEQFNQGIERLNALLFGFQDYAVIGRKGLASANEDLD